MPEQNSESGKDCAWHRAVETTLCTNISADITFKLIENDSQLAAIIRRCNFVQANTLARLVRNGLMRKYPLRKPSIAVTCVDAGTVYNGQFNADDLLTELCAELNQNAAKKSSRIEVKRFELKS